MLTLFTEVYPDYVIASIPFDTKEQVDEKISKYPQSLDCTAYYCETDGKWYVLEKKTW